MNNKAKLLTGVAFIALAMVTAQHFVNEQAPAPVTSDEAQQVQDLVDSKVGQQPVTVTVPPTPNIAGSYLSARFAIGVNDMKSANKYFQQAVELSADTKEKNFFFEHALPAALGSGDIKAAIDYSKKIDLNNPTATAQLAVLTLAVEGFKNNDFDAVSKLLPQMRTDGFGRLLKPLVEAWDDAGKKDYDAAMAALQKLNKDYPSLQPLVQMHMAFLYDLQDQKDTAENYYKISLNNNLSIRSAYIMSQFYEREGNTTALKDLYTKLSAKVPGTAYPTIVLNRINSGKLNKRAFIGKPSDGVAAALYDVATVLHQEGSSRLAILYAQLAHYLAPEDNFTKLLLGDIQSSEGMRDAAIDYLQSVPKDDDLYILAQMRLAQLFEEDEKYDQAVNVLRQFQDDPLIKTQAKNELADLYRRKEDYAKAIPLYTDIINARQPLKADDWTLLYARGVSYERSNQWDKAEADLLEALKLNPQQPEVLNYLAYSWADHGKNLQKALDMLKKALTAAPEDPYITDSVGWALYKNGQAEEAVPYLESSVQALPADAVINGHLGDTYWAVGRHLEANFQWERALKNTKPNETELKKEYTEKLQHGLPDNQAKEKKVSTN